MKLIFLSLALSIIAFAANAQQWSGSNNSTDPITRTGNVGIGTPSPQGKLHISGGHVVFEVGSGSNPTIFTGTGTSELNKYLALNNSPGHGTASGLKAGGILISDSYAYANPSKNDLIVKGNVGIGTPTPQAKFHINGGHLLIDAGTGSNSTIFTGTGTTELNKYLTLINSPGLTSASGLKAGGLLVSDLYSYANPGKNDIIVKGKIGIGTPNPEAALDVKGRQIYLGTIPVSIGYSSNEYPSVGYNTTYTNSSYSYTYKANDDASLIYFGHGGFSFKTAPVGTSGNAIPFSEVMTIKQNGTVGIGTTNPGSFRLAVEGKVGAREVVVTSETTWPDYVFEPNYNVPALSELEQYIKTNKHLPEVPTANEVKENGLSLGEMNAILLKKVEELTLHLIANEKVNEKQSQEIERLKDLVSKMN